MKTIQVSETVHRELKVFVASGKTEFPIHVVAGVAIMEYLRANGHKFLTKESKQSNKK